MAGENPARSIQPDDRILHVNVEDPLGKLAKESGRVDPLPDQVAGIEIKAELRPAAKGIQGTFGRIQIEGDFRGVYFQANFTPHSPNTSRIGFQRSAKSWNPASIIAAETGGNE